MSVGYNDGMDIICPYCLSPSSKHHYIYNEQNIILDAYWECVNCKINWQCSQEFWYHPIKERKRFCSEMKSLK